MKWFSVIQLLILLLANALLASADTSNHPKLVMTQSDVEKIRQQLGNVPLFDASLAAAMAEVDAEIALGISTPTPLDYSGGFTHERHKKNYAVAQKAGALYLILGEKKYANYVRDMLLQYASIYNDLPLHPKSRSYARGKIFWQCLNDANWLVYMSQAYDAIYSSLSSTERKILETKLFRPFADHISIANPQFFNRIHNHSTWGTAAVGMIGLVMGDNELVQRALYGLNIDNFSDATDDDGGFIRKQGQKAGFFANLDSAFSPDGYYTEGPYYQRYAMYPFLVFAQSLSNAGYAEQAFERNQGVLLKAVETLIQLSDNNGDFFPLNDAQKGMSLLANEIVTAIDVAYQAGQDPRLLSIAQLQQRVLLDGAGFAAAAAIAEKKSQPFKKSSVALTDGANGTDGGLAILRDSNESLALVFKYTAQGLSHGHYDKLAFSFYEQGNEILQDYGMARFVNIGQKGGGNYLAENSTWAKQSIAHNTLVINEASHFEGNYENGSQHHSELIFFDTESATAQVVSAQDLNAYPKSPMKRSMALLQLPGLEAPVVLDILEVRSSAENQYDLPFHYLGQPIDTNFNPLPVSPLESLGGDHGYQHLYLEARGSTDASNAKFTWLHKERFFTLTAVTQSGDELLMTRLGANDPQFNLRRDPSLIIRRKASDSLFVSVLEPHGSYNPVTELAANAVSNIVEVQVLTHTSKYLAIKLVMQNGQHAVFYLSQNSDFSANHQLQIGKEKVEWSGPFHFREVTHP
jgi:hypothetical protein